MIVQKMYTFSLFQNVSLLSEMGLSSLTLVEHPTKVFSSTPLWVQVNGNMNAIAFANISSGAEPKNVR